ncbi:MAG: hypothetical protein EP329_07455 [Deltaproteobacteria bacterium]|nr:MAG: hypothetical protein EP329_07455 [Deltaproteobacteria bacterium]
MKRNPGLYIAVVGLSLPLLWLAATTDLLLTTGGALALAGGLVTYLWLCRVLWRAHLKGRFAANRCATCDHPMAMLPPGALREARETATVPPHRWVCRHCGRLV